MPWNNHRTGWSRYLLRAGVHPSTHVSSAFSVARAVSQSTQGAGLGTSLRSCPGKGLEFTEQGGQNNPPMKPGARNAYPDGVLLA